MKNFSRALFKRTDGHAFAMIIGLAAIKLLIHLLTSSNYGYFRDEFYYIAASRNLAFGYVDFPPFIALLTAFVRLVAGDSLLALRFFPALAGFTQCRYCMAYENNVPIYICRNMKEPINQVWPRLKVFQ